ncbi:MAG: AbrB/MazE/SpoVT family DNA-binding domain-containing protein [Bacillota bacterium]|nr:AbrB/MazE/SpoVT family DNA-binding domain-containing protein [Bacillota bacterium]
MVLKKSEGDTSVAGDIRCLDKFGRIVIPIEIRNLFNIVPQIDSLEIYCEDNNIILKKYEPSCVFCGSSDTLISFKGKKICASCLNELKR